MPYDVLEVKTQYCTIFLGVGHFFGDPPPRIICQVDSFFSVAKIH